MGNYGTVFRLWPPQTPDVTAFAAASNGVTLSFAGVAGFNYQVLRSTNFTNWIAVSTNAMPASGTLLYIDEAPPRPAGYYRAAWIP